MLRSPIVFIVFNRPNLAVRVFEQIRRAQPQKLFVIADGPRENCPDDAALIKKSLALLDMVDWKCEVVKDVAVSNMGAGLRIASGLSRIFEQTDRAIIVEDDCLPDQSFFGFCDELLERFNDDERVMSIVGTNYAHHWPNEYSYFFSKQFSPWGWATWARAWCHFNYSIDVWKQPEIKEKIKSYLDDDFQFNFRSGNFETVLPGGADIWDYQWTFAHFLNRKVVAVPVENLVKNIGFGPQATHCVELDDRLVLPSRKLRFPLKHPHEVQVDIAYDRHMIKQNAPRIVRPNIVQEMRILGGRVKRKLLKGLKWRE